jgi:hypothetical protein
VVELLEIACESPPKKALAIVRAQPLFPVKEKDRVAAKRKKSAMRMF